MKQKAAIEKTYAESLHKLSTVYGSKKVASKVGLEVKDGDHLHQSSGGQRERIKTSKVATAMRSSTPRSLGPSAD